MSTGAVVAGRGTFEPAGGWGGDHHDGVRIFTLYRQQPGIDISHWPLVTPVNDIETAMAKAKEAAGYKKRAGPRSRNRAASACGWRPRRARAARRPGASSAMGAVCSRASLLNRSSWQRTRILEGEVGVALTCTIGSSTEL